MKHLIAFTAVVLMAVPTLAGVVVEADDSVDFKDYRTYAWIRGTDAARPEVQQWIAYVLERELAEQGLQKVAAGAADLYLVTHAFATLDSASSANFVNVRDMGVITSDIVLSTKGSLTVDLIDRQTEQPVWRGMATDVMVNPSEDKIRKKVEKVARKMFKHFPAR